MNNNIKLICSRKALKFSYPEINNIPQNILQSNKGTNRRKELKITIYNSPINQKILKSYLSPRNKKVNI